jgi:hypothetical protein
VAKLFAGSDLIGQSPGVELEEPPDDSFVIAEEVKVKKPRDKYLVALDDAWSKLDMNRDFDLDPCSCADDVWSDASLLVNAYNGKKKKGRGRKRGASCPGKTLNITVVLIPGPLLMIIFL